MRHWSLLRWLALKAAEALEDTDNRNMQGSVVIPVVCTNAVLSLF